VATIPRPIDKRLATPHPGNRTDLRGHPDLSLFSPGLPEQAGEAFEVGDVKTFLGSGPTRLAAAILFWNFHALRAHGLYEKALLAGLRAMANVPEAWGDVWLYLFERGDPKALRALSDPFPHAGPFVLYRGIAGEGRSRDERGLCWTESLERARWYAERFHLAKPRVLRVRLPTHQILAYLADPGEEQFLVLLPESAGHIEMWPTDSLRARRQATR